MLQYGLSSEEWDLKEVKEVTDEGYEGRKKGHAPPMFVHANLLKHSGYSE